MVHFIFIAPMHSYVTNVLVYNLHMTIFSRVYLYVLVCTRMLLVCTRMLLVCYLYVTPMHSCVTRMLLVCTRMLLVCYSCVVLVTIVKFDVELTRQAVIFFLFLYIFFYRIAKGKLN